MSVKYEWEETRTDGSVETWDIELREYKEPKEECEALLKEVIREVNIELAETRKQAKAS